ncbi:hypothetical protein CF133_23185 [Aeromonas salmonicida]|nr:hypothetical protein CF133_23185 [Aeromonas salmonicida]
MAAGVRASLDGGGASPAGLPADRPRGRKGGGSRGRNGMQEVRLGEIHQGWKWTSICLRRPPANTSVVTRGQRQADSDQARVAGLVTGV